MYYYCLASHIGSSDFFLSIRDASDISGSYDSYIDMLVAVPAIQRIHNEIEAIHILDEEYPVLLLFVLIKII